MSKQDKNWYMDFKNGFRMALTKEQATELLNKDFHFQYQWDDGGSVLVLKYEDENNL